MKDVAYLQNLIEECDKHAARLGSAIVGLEGIFPLTPTTLDGLPAALLPVLDQMVYRYSRLQDTIGSKMFREVLVHLGVYEPGMSYIDMLNKLEKEEILPSAHQWRDIRELRNHLSHEYPSKPEVLVEYLNSTPKLAKLLLDYWSYLRPKVQNLIG